MLNPDSVLRKTADVRHRTIADEGIVLKQESAEVIVLNETGARILDLIGQGKPLGEIIDTLAEEYEVERGPLERDVMSYVAALTEAGIVEEETRSSTEDGR